MFAESSLSKALEADRDAAPQQHELFEIHISSLVPSEGATLVTLTLHV